MASGVKRLHAPWVLLADGWHSDQLLEIDGQGMLAGVASGQPAQADQSLPGPVLPAMPNVHSHAHQRLMAGLTGRAGNRDDSFWTWREQMYRVVGGIGPEELRVIAAWLYLELIEGGYTTSGEFHYAHRLAGARALDSAQALIEAASETGMALTLLPVWYRYSGFGRKTPASAQSPFVLEPDDYQRLVSDCRRMAGEQQAVVVGLAPHSLRAVAVEDLTPLLAEFPDLPVHIHIAEQTGEVEACRAWHGDSPVRVLFDQVDIDDRWCLVHATHADGDELERMARARVVAGLCPTTEADLGDGIFTASDYLAQGGRIAIGSDSNLVTSAAEELRLLEWSQRYRLAQRNVLADCTGVGRFLWARAGAGGAAALRQPVGQVGVGKRADFIVLDQQHPLLAGLSADWWLDVFVFHGGHGMINEVWCAGQRQVSGGRHRARERLLPAFVELRRRLQKAAP